MVWTEESLDMFFSAESVHKRSKARARERVRQGIYTSSLLLAGKVSSKNSVVLPSSELLFASLYFYDRYIGIDNVWILSQRYQSYSLLSDFFKYETPLRI